MLERLPGATVEFLTRSSVLDELSGPLCDRVLATSGSGVVLHELMRRNLLLAPVDSRHESYRLHGLLRELLAAELQRSGPELPRRLHLRASAWFAEQHDPDRAIEHAVAAGDPVRAGDLLWSSVAGYAAEGRNSSVREWLTRFDDSEIAGHAPLALAASYSSLMAGDLARAEHWARSAAAVGPSRARRANGTAVAVIEAAAGRDGPPRMREDAGRALAAAAPDSAWRPLCLLLLGVADLLSGEVDGAERELGVALAQSAIAAPVAAALCAAELAIIAIERGDWEAAGELADRALAMVDAHGLGDCPTVALVFAAAAATRTHTGRADEGKRHLLLGTRLLTLMGDFLPWYEVQTRVLLARAALQLADLVRARTLLAEASRYARRTRDTALFQSWFDAAWGEIDSHVEVSLVGPSSLTTAELRILRFLPTHLSFREIATRLHVSSNTVKSQAHAVYRKLDASSRSEAVARASEAGLLGP